MTTDKTGNPMMIDFPQCHVTSSMSGALRSTSESLGTTRRVFLALLLLGNSLLTACGSKDEEAADDANNPSETDTAPTIPPPGSLTIETGIGDEGETVSSASSFATPNSFPLWQGFATHMASLAYGKARIGVAFVRLTVATSVSIPILLIKKAQLATPQFEGDATWVWSFDLTHSGVVYTGNFRGTKTATGSDWSMRVSSDGDNSFGVQYDDFEFFTGKVTVKTSGTWTVRDPAQPSDPVDLYSIEYDYTDAANKSATFTIGAARAEAETFTEGSYVEYIATSTDHTMNLLDKSTGNTDPAVIYWTRETGAGSLTQQGEKECWGERPDFVDVTCEE